MQRVIVERFGGPEVLQLREEPDPAPGTSPGPGEVVVRLTSIGMNHAELMGRRGAYKLSTGDPPFTPGLEGGGVIEAVGDGVLPERIGERVTLSPVAPRRPNAGGAYVSHYVCAGDDALPAPDAVPDDQLGALWLPYLTAWGALCWKADLQPGQTVACPAASSSTALAAAQVARRRGATAVGLTTSFDKADALRPHYDHLVVTHEDSGGERVMRKWYRDLKALTDGRGVDVFFDPVAAGAYLSAEVRSLADHGVILVYGLLGDPAADGPVDVTPLIRKHASIVGYVNDELFSPGQGDGTPPWQDGVAHVFDGFAEGVYRQALAGTFPLSEVRRAHETMERGGHVGKLVLIPDP
ncbi:MAG: zinc-binding dehydrogenase [Planctomycetota bacterium]